MQTYDTAAMRNAHHNASALAAERTPGATPAFSTPMQSVYSNPSGAKSQGAPDTSLCKPIGGFTNAGIMSGKV